MFKSVCSNGYGSKLNHQATTGFSPCFMYQDSIFGYIFTAKSQLDCAPFFVTCPAQRTRCPPSSSHRLQAALCCQPRQPGQARIEPLAEVVSKNAAKRSFKSLKLALKWQSKLGIWGQCEREATTTQVDDATAIICQSGNFRIKGPLPSPPLLLPLPPPLTPCRTPLGGKMTAPPNLRQAHPYRAPHRHASKRS